jgi:hypothetical protein
VPRRRWSAAAIVPSFPFFRFAILIAFVHALAACGAVAGSPIAPDAGSDDWIVPEVLKPAVALIDSDDRAAPFLGEPAGVWLRRVVRGVQIDSSLPAHVRAQCCGSDRMIRWSTGWLPDVNRPDDVRVAAAILVHEARHAQGYRHTCPDQRRDRTFNEGGAWAVQAAWLRHMGDHRTADSITAADIGCE